MSGSNCHIIPHAEIRRIHGHEGNNEIERRIGTEGGRSHGDVGVKWDDRRNLFGAGSRICPNVEVDRLDTIRGSCGALDITSADFEDAALRANDEGVFLSQIVWVDVVLCLIKTAFDDDCL